MTLLALQGESGENMSLMKQNAEGKGKEEKGEIDDEPPRKGTIIQEKERKRGAQPKSSALNWSL